MKSNLVAGALNVAMSTARDTGKLIAQNMTKLDRIRVSEKSTSNYKRELVSEIDLLAEQTIIEQLDEAYPGFNIISEESGEQHRDSEYTWVIDPLDGTHNFLHGHPHFCVSIALKFEDEVVATAVFDPLRNELFSARKGAGAQLDGRRIRVSENGKLRDSLLVTGFPYTGGEQTKRWLKSFAALMPRAQSVHRAGSSILDLAYVACGRYDGFWEFGLQEWDIAGGSLLVKEAGGMVTDISGDNNEFKSGNLIAGNPKIHEKLSHLLGQI